MQLSDCLADIHKVSNLYTANYMKDIPMTVSPVWQSSPFLDCVVNAGEWWLRGVVKQAGRLSVLGKRTAGPMWPSNAIEMCSTGWLGCWACDQKVVGSKPRFGRVISALGPRERNRLSVEADPAFFTVHHTRQKQTLNKLKQCLSRPGSSRRGIHRTHTRCWMETPLHSFFRLISRFICISNRKGHNAFCYTIAWLQLGQVSKELWREACC